MKIDHKESYKDFGEQFLTDKDIGGYWGSVELLKSVLNIPNIIFLSGLIFIAQLVPSAPSSIGVFNYLVIEALEFFFRINNVEFDIMVKAQITSISFIVLIISILPDITWGFAVFVKETSVKLKDLRLLNKN